MSYKRNTNANRDALFGGGDGGAAPKKKSGSKSAAANREALLGSGAAAASSKSSSKATASAPKPTTASTSSQPSSSSSMRTTLEERRKGKSKKPALRGEARTSRLRQAEEYRDKANECMKTGLFKKPDPVAASTYYKRAADAYQQAGDEDYLERLYRQESARCNLQIGAWASAAGDYTRAAELLIPKDCNDVADIDESTAPDYPTLEKRRFAASVFHKEAAKAYTESTC